MSEIPEPTPEPTRDAPTKLLDLLEALSPDEDQDRMSVSQMLERIGGRSFPAFILVPAVILVSPVSGIPGTPTIGALIILLITLQGLFGRSHLWLPGFLRRRSISSHRLRRGIDWLRRPAGWMDRNTRHRLLILVRGPTRLVAYAATAILAAGWPLLELLPFVTSFGAGAVSMIMFGLMTRDGLYTLLGYIQGTVIYAILFTLWTGLV